MLPRVIDGTAAESSGQQMFNNINRNHLGTVGGKPVLQKSPVLIKVKHLVVDSGFLTLLSSSTESLTDKSPARTKEW